MLDRSRFKHEPTSTFPAILLRLFMLKNAAVLRFFCARRAERIKYRRFSKSCKVSPTSLWLITLGFTILIAPCQFFYFRKTFSDRPDFHFVHNLFTHAIRRESAQPQIKIEEQKMRIKKTVVKCRFLGLKKANYVVG